MSVDDPDDVTLVRGAVAGNETDGSAVLSGNLAALYERYADMLFAFICHRMAGERSDAEDVFQETWLAALKSLQSYRGQSSFFTWLCSIARNKIVDAFRRRKRCPAQSLEDLPEGQLSALQESGPLPDEILQREDARVRVVLAMATLPDEYRTALAARYGDQRRVEEMAQLLGKSLKATESLLSRARQAFREALSRMETEESDGQERQKRQRTMAGE